MALFALGIMIVLLTGSVPLTSSISDSMSPLSPKTKSQLTTELATNAGVTTEASDPTAPYAVPTLTISTLYHAAAAFFSYARYSTTGSTAFALGSVGSTALAAVGLWCILFASSSGRISRKTGADKRTSGFPFGNKESASSKKKGLRKVN
jgi:hypothetical protein